MFCSIFYKKHQGFLFVTADSLLFRLSGKLFFRLPENSLFLLLSFLLWFFLGTLHVHTHFATMPPSGADAEGIVALEGSEVAMDEAATTSDAEETLEEDTEQDPVLTDVGERVEEESQRAEEGEGAAAGEKQQQQPVEADTSGADAGPASTDADVVAASAATSAEVEENDTNVPSLPPLSREKSPPAATAAEATPPPMPEGAIDAINVFEYVQQLPQETIVHLHNQLQEMPPTTPLGGRPGGPRLSSYKTPRVSFTKSGGVAASRAAPRTSGIAAQQQAHQLQQQQQQQHQRGFGDRASSRPVTLPSPGGRHDVTTAPRGGPRATTQALPAMIPPVTAAHDFSIDRLMKSHHMLLGLPSAVSAVRLSESFGGRGICGEGFRV